MSSQDVYLLIRKGEDSKTQFKKQIDSVDALAAEMCAFSNSEGGIILVGLEDDGEITGMSNKQVSQLNQMISNAASQKIDPPVHVTTETVLLDEKVIMLIKIPQGTNKFYMANGKDIWIKLGADKRRAKREELQRLLQASGHVYADESVVTGTGISNLNIALIEEFLYKRTGLTVEQVGITLKSLIENIKIMKNGQCTLAGLIMFGKHPEYALPSMIIKAVHFVGNDASGTQYRDSRDINGNLLQQFLAARAFLVNNLKMAQGDQGFNSTGILEIPIEAIEEALINALVHRDYFYTSSIRIFVFDNRIEIISPGALVNTLNIDAIKMGIRIDRNPILVSIIRDIPEIPYRGMGTGIRRILRSCEAAGIKVDFDENRTPGQFKVIFWRKRYD